MIFYLFFLAQSWMENLAFAFSMPFLLTRRLINAERWKLNIYPSFNTGSVTRDSVARHLTVKFSLWICSVVPSFAFSSSGGGPRRFLRCGGHCVQTWQVWEILPLPQHEPPPKKERGGGINSVLRHKIFLLIYYWIEPGIYHACI